MSTARSGSPTGWWPRAATGWCSPARRASRRPRRTPRRPRWCGRCGRRWATGRRSWRGWAPPTPGTPWNWPWRPKRRARTGCWWSAPYYSRPPQDAVEAHFREIADASRAAAHAVRHPGPHRHPDRAGDDDPARGASADRGGQGLLVRPPRHPEGAGPHGVGVLRGLRRVRPRAVRGRCGRATSARWRTWSRPNSARSSTRSTAGDTPEAARLQQRATAADRVDDVGGPARHGHGEGAAGRARSARGPGPGPAAARRPGGGRRAAGGVRTTRWPP